MKRHRGSPQPQRDTRVIGEYRRTVRCEHGFAVGSGLCRQCVGAVHEPTIGWQESFARANVARAVDANKRARRERIEERARTINVTPSVVPAGDVDPRGSRSS